MPKTGLIVACHIIFSMQYQSSVQTVRIFILFITDMCDTNKMILGAGLVRGGFVVGVMEEILIYHEVFNESDTKLRCAR